MDNAQKGQDYTIFVLHDADPDGYNIARTLQEETARMPDHNIEVIDLGLSILHAVAMELENETFMDYDNCLDNSGLPKHLLDTEMCPCESELAEMLLLYRDAESIIETFENDLWLVEDLGLIAQKEDEKPKLFLVA
ncbi:MAG: hypothetical protein KZQ83_13335 [gamma proteobacterium symbiont of Taylorina sp.]|nr:hypothetical protein [gamma proteobacterium symbiont of Taylorina sp.]